MSDASTAPVGTGTPAAPAIPPPPITPPAPPPVVAPVAAPVVAPLAAPVPDPALDSAWLADRLKRAEEKGARDKLKAIGAESDEQARSAIAAAETARLATLSAEQRALEAGQRETAAQQTVTRQQQLIKEQAGRMMMVLSPEQQKAVSDFAGDDPAEQLRAIQHFAPLWSKAAHEAAVVAPAAVPLTPPTPGALPANTAPPPNAPPGGLPTSPPNHRAVYTQLAGTNPFAAAAYGLTHINEVHGTKPA